MKHAHEISSSSGNAKTGSGKAATKGARTALSACFRVAWNSRTRLPALLRNLCRTRRETALQGQPPQQIEPARVIACKTCGQVQQLESLPCGHRVECARCGEVLLRQTPFSRERTAAFSLAALFLYVPANIYPVMVMQYLGRQTENTVWGGVRALWQDNMWGVAIIVFLASILVPLLKLLGLFFLVTYHGERWRNERRRIYKFIEKIGPWAMLDVFLLAIMVGVIRFGSFATVIPGPGIVAFTSVVVLTLLASASFEPRLIWKDGTFEHDA
jgi:uncharacterized paraquat-inducible protein A